MKDDKLLVRVKSEFKRRVQKEADRLGLTLSDFIINAINNEILKERNFFGSKEIPFDSEWLGNMGEFLSWCYEQKTQIEHDAPAHGQSMGYAKKVFCNKYPTFKDAYREWKRMWDKI